MLGRKRKNNINFPAYVWDKSDSIRTKMLESLPEHAALLGDEDKWRLLFTGIAVGTKLKVKETTRGENKEILADAMSLDPQLSKVVMNYLKFHNKTLVKLNSVDELHERIGYWLVYQLKDDSEPATKEVQDFAKIPRRVFDYIEDYRARAITPL